MPSPVEVWKTKGKEWVSKLTSEFKLSDSSRKDGWGMSLSSIP